MVKEKAFTAVIKRLLDHIGTDFTFNVEKAKRKRLDPSLKKISALRETENKKIVSAKLYQL